jgi:hypothetical protein
MTILKLYYSTLNFELQFGVFLCHIISGHGYPIRLINQDFIFLYDTTNYCLL